MHFRTCCDENKEKERFLREQLFTELASELNKNMKYNEDYCFRISIRKDELPCPTPCGDKYLLEITSKDIPIFKESISIPKLVPEEESSLKLPFTWKERIKILFTGRP